MHVICGEEVFQGKEKLRKLELILKEIVKRIEEFSFQRGLEKVEWNN